MYQNYDYSEMFTPEEILVYLRKSQSDDPLLTVEEVLQKHETILDEWAEKHFGRTVPEENKFREVVSGETIKGRPEINKMLRLMENPKYKAVNIIEPQRLTRGDLEDIGRLMKLLKHTNTLVITPERTYNLRDEYDWDMFERELKRGNEYLTYYKKIQNRGRIASVRAGNYIGSIPPYGFDKVWVKYGKKKCPTLAENKEQADVVRMIFDMYVNKDMGRPSICYHLDDMGVKPPKGKHWSPAALKDLLSNIHYIGKVKWNWRQTVQVVEDGEILATRPKNKIGEYLIFDGKHNGIVSEELFNAAQEKTGRNHSAKAKTKVRNPLAGIVYCQCGRAMTFRTYKRNGEERSAPRLICDDQIHCGTGSCLYSEMIDRVRGILKESISDFEIRIKNDDGSSAKIHAKLIANLEKRLAELNAQELNQWEAQTHPDESKRMPPEIFQQLSAKLRAERDEVQNALCKARENMPEPVNYHEQLKRFTDALNALNNDAIDAQTKNRLLKACIERITYSRDKPQRTPSQQNRVTVDGQHTYASPPQRGANWTNTEISLDIKLRV